ncbi:MAG TPA: HAMP domain-containing sensor histidine kinase [Acidobacteriaceae bacterium]|nr:HAMP domain-containing sensor histidine kinase [Acidobacteriaceae bacterium]
MTGLDRHRSNAERSQAELDRVADVLRENQKLITLGRLTASIAHEINNPLESITNLLYLIEQDKSGNVAEYLQIAQRELARVVQITRQTLTFTRENSVPVRVELADLIEEVLGLYVRRISDKQLRIVREYETREQVRMLPGEMRQVLSNLISNALEASAPHGRIVMRIHESSYWTQQGRERGLRFSIGDNGAGISPEVRNHLGQPFFTTKGQSGTGLGLWVTQAILNRYGSSLQVRSSIESARHGTVCSFVLPLKLRPVKVVNGDDPEDSPGGGPRVLRGSGPRLVGRDSTDSAREDDRPTGRTGRENRLLPPAACGD